MDADPNIQKIAYNEKEAAELAEAARSAVVNTGLAGVGVGIGVAIAAAAHVVWIDVTGISAAVLAAASLRPRCVEVPWFTDHFLQISHHSRSSPKIFFL